MMKVSVSSFSQCLTTAAKRPNTWVRAAKAAAVIATLGGCDSTPPLTPVTAGASAQAAAGATVIAGSSVAPVAGVAGSSVAPRAGTGTVAAGMGAAGTVATGGPSTFTDVLAILADSKNNCGLCHKMMTLGGGLVFDPANKLGTYTALAGVKSMGTLGSQCGGKTYVVAGKPDESLLYDKVSKATPSCGVRMPASGAVLDDPEIATIRAWIMAGALNN